MNPFHVVKPSDSSAVLNAALWQCAEPKMYKTCFLSAAPFGCSRPFSNAFCATPLVRAVTLASSRSSPRDGFFPLKYDSAGHSRQHTRGSGINAQWSPGSDSADTRSFPFAEQRFDSLKLSPMVLRRLVEEGLKVPTDVQVAAIPAILDGHDTAIQSYTGSGKTLAVLLPVLSRIGPLSGQAEASRKGGIEAVIVAPSRELAMQIVREAERLLGPNNHDCVQQLIGGANVKNQETALRKNKPAIVVGTPGRISDISRAGRLHTHGCRFLVLDEADQLLSLKFRDSMQRILEHVGQRRSPDLADLHEGNMMSRLLSVPSKVERRVERQTVLLSATMPPAVLRAACTWGRKPLLVRATSVVEVDEGGSDPSFSVPEIAAPVPDSLPPNLQHWYVVCPLQRKVDTARRCIHALQARSVLVFMNHARTVKDVVFKLEARGLAAGALHGELTKVQRSNVLTAFRNGKIRVLVCTEVAARGLDVPGCDLVVNVELPTDGPHYAHRAGRTGRLGRRGNVISICENPEEFVVSKFERQLGIAIPRCEPKEGKFTLSPISAAV